MNRHILVSLLAFICVALSAQSISTVRGAYHIRHKGISFIGADGATWVFWDQTNGDSYQMKAMKYDKEGIALFPQVVTISGIEGSHRVLDAQPASDGGVVLVYMADEGMGRHSAAIQKLNASAQPQWGPEGILFSQNLWSLYPVVHMQANALGGAYLLFRDQSGDYAGVYQCRNYNAAGDNLWTYSPGFASDHWRSITQLILMDSGDLIISLSDFDGNYLQRVNNSGAVIGDLPMFPVGYPFRGFLNIINGSSNQYLICNYDYNAGVFRMQLMNEDGNMVFSTPRILSIPGTFGYVYLQKVVQCPDGGFIACFKIDLEGLNPGHRLTLIRLDSELEPIWGDLGVIAYETTDIMGDIDLFTDSNLETWLGITQSSTNYQAQQVIAMRIDPDGGVSVSPKEISVLEQFKEGLKVLSLEEGAMYSWLDFHDDRVSLTRQIIDNAGTELLAQNGERISSCLKGNANLLGRYVLGDNTLVLMSDDRFGYSSLYYQILDSTGSSLLEQDGRPLISGLNQPTRLTKSFATGQNTVGIVLSQAGSNGEVSLFYQEIDLNGNLLYPEPGLLIDESAASALSILPIAEGDARILYWDFPASEWNYRKILAQKLMDGAWQWAEPKIVVDRVNERLVPRAASPGYLIFNSDSGTYNDKLYVLHLDSSLEPIAAWDPGGELLMEIENPWMTHVQGSRLIGDYLYTVIIYANGMDYTISVQKSSAANPREWGETGLIVATGDGGQMYLSRTCFSEMISIFWISENEGIWLQKISYEGEYLIPGDGFLMYPGLISDSHREFLVHGSGNVSSFYGELSGITHNYFDANFAQNDQPSIPIKNTISLSAELIQEKTLLIANRLVSDEYDYDQAYVTSLLAAVMDEPGATLPPDPPEPEGLILKQNRPNPFKRFTTISFETEASKVNIEIYNLRGQRVRSASQNLNQSGKGSWSWDGEDQNGNKCAAGVYFYRVKCAKHSQTKKMLLLRQ